MANKKDKTTKNAGRWTENKLELFAEVQPDPENKFSVSMEKLTQKSQQIMKYSIILKMF